MQWFISRAIYDPEPMIKLLKEYGALCKKNIAQRGHPHLRPCGREKTWGSSNGRRHCPEEVRGGDSRLITR